MQHLNYSVAIIYGTCNVFPMISSLHFMLVLSEVLLLLLLTCLLIFVCDVQLDNGGKVILKAALDAIQDCPGFKDQSVLDKVATTCANLPEGKTPFT